MQLSLPSLFSSSLALTILILLLYIIIKVNCIIKYLGINCIYIFALMILIRGFLPFEIEIFHITKTYPSDIFVPMIQKIVSTPLISKTSSFTVLTLLLMIWLIIAVMKLIIRIVGYLSYYKRIKDFAKTSILSLNTLKIFNLVSNKIFKKNIYCHLLQIDHITTPAVFGLTNPIIMLPNILYNDNDLYYIFLHELLHIKHKDFLTKISCDILSSLYWWNPIISTLYPLLICQLQELRVDYYICKSANKTTKNLYLECLRKTIVHSSNLSNKNSHSLYAFCDNSSNRNLMQRLKFITMKGINNRITFGPIIIFFVFIFLSFSFIVEAFNQPEYSEEGEKVFYKSKIDSYFVKNGVKFDLYLSGKYVYTTSEIISDFQDLPIYNEIPQEKE